MELAAYAAALPFAAGLSCPVIPGSLPERSSDHHTLLPTAALGTTRWTALPAGEGAC